MALRKVTFTPANATPSLGARLASSGGGLPARLTEELDRHFASIIPASSGVQFDPDGNIWVIHSTNGLQKYNSTTGALILTVTQNTAANRNIVTPQGLTRRGNKLYFACSGAGTYIGEYDMVTTQCELYAQVVGTAAVVAAPCHVACGEAGKIWVRTGAATSGTYTEEVLAGTGNTATATTTARTVATAWDCVGDGAGFVYFALSASVTKYNLGTGVIDVTFTPTPTILTDWPGGGTNVRQLAWDATTSTLLVGFGGATAGDDWYRMNAGLTEVTARIFGFVEFTGFAPSSNTTFHRNPIAFSDDGRLVAYTAVGISGTPAAPVSVRIATIGPQRATWTWTPTVKVSVDGIAVSGALGNASGVIESLPTSPAALLNGTYNFERVKFYYSLSGGVSDVQFNPDEDALAITVNGGQTLTIYAVFQRNIDDLAGPRPWIGSNSGVALRVFFNIAEPRLGGL